jgi:hypothetical protein
MNWSRVFVFGASLFATLNPSLALENCALPPSGKPNPIYPEEAQITSNGIMNAQSTDLAYLFVVERGEEEDQTM